MARLALALILLIFIVNFIAMSRDWYETVWWFDIPMHFLGGVWLGLVFSYLFFERLSLGSSNPSFLVYLLLIFGSVALVGISWEFFEYFRDAIVANYIRGDVLDTLADLFNDLLGSAVSGALIWRHYKSSRPERG